jgi:hypothetical protein
MTPPITVTFDPNANPQFTFNYHSVTVNAKGTVILQQGGTNPQWTFASPGAIVLGDYLGQFSASVVGNGKQVNIQDDLADPPGQQVAYCYACIVTQGGKTYTSQDPDIVNDPGSTNGRPARPPIRKSRPNQKSAKQGATKKAARPAKSAKKR